MIRGLSPIPRGGGKPEGKEGDCISTLGALRPIEGVWVRTHSFGAFLNPGIQQPPPAGSPKNHSPRRGPTILGGTFGARVRATSLRTAGARLRTLRAPLGTHPVGACCASASNKRASFLRTPRIGVVQVQTRYFAFEKECARSSTLRIIFVHDQARYSVFEKCSAGYGSAPKGRPSCLRTPRTSFVRDQARYSVFEKISAGIGTPPPKSARRV